MLHHLQHIADLVEICRSKGIQQVVVSPGSRNAPLIKLFASNNFFKLHSIVDERSAAFYGLGIALATQQAVVLVCTSGTAALNYAPALAEAYYQGVPLIAITADRPEKLIDQQDNQTIRQINVYQNYIKESIHLHQPLHNTDELRKLHHAIHQIIDNALSGIKGPVHINVPIAEPLYVEIPLATANIKPCIPKSEQAVNATLLVESWKTAQRKLIICGEATPNPKLNNIVNHLATIPGVVVLAEPISNLNGSNVISTIDRVMMLIETFQMSDFQPDLLISFGGPIVSKRLKQWLQKQPGLTHYRISEAEDQIDTYQNLSGTIIGQTDKVLQFLLETETFANTAFALNWKSAQHTSELRHNAFITQAAYSELKAIAYAINVSKAETILHLGNSTPVRYGQLFNAKKFEAVFANRGVSGIDGCVSTAAGVASQSNKINLLIVGDLSFVYDSNSLWNKNLGANFKIVVINNGGGGIFSLLPSLSEIEGFDEYIETNHPVNIQKIAEAFGVKYFSCQNEQQLHKVFRTFLMWATTPALFEIITPKTINAQVFKKYVDFIKQDH